MITSAEASAIAARTILQEKREVRIQLHGNCMWPIVKNGDFLTIKKCPINQLKLGDVAVGSLSEKEYHVYAQCIPFKRNGVHEKNYLGKVTEIDRKGHRILLDQRSTFKKILQVLICRSNPWFLGAPKTIYQKIMKKEPGRL